MPEHVSFPAAVAAVGTGRTALAIVELEPPRPDDVVLVPSAAGGLGWLLVQAAHAVGATVVAAAGGSRRTAALADLRPQLVVDYADPRWTERVRAEVGPVTRRVRRGRGRGRPGGRSSCSAPGGRLVMFGYSPVRRPASTPATSSSGR